MISEKSSKIIENVIDQIQLSKLDNGQKEKILRSVISEFVKIFYHHIQKPKKKFIENETYISHAEKCYDYNEMISLVQSGLDFWLTQGRFSNSFSRSFAKYMGVRHCLLTNSGSSANLLAISALSSDMLKHNKLIPDDEILTVSTSFPTTVTPIYQNNFIPVYCDIDLKTLNIKSDEIEESISSKTKAIMLAHTLSNPFNLNVILKIKEKHNLWLIEDNCDAVGSTYNGKLTGTFGDLSTNSFFPAHHITMGEGGAVLTNSSKLKRIVESFRDWGRDCWCNTGKDNTCGKRFEWELGQLTKGYDHKFIYSHLGYNLKLTDMQAAVGVEQLKKLPDFINKRINNWNYLHNFFKKYSDFFILQQATENSQPSWYGFSLILSEKCPFSRIDIVKYLENHKIRTRLIFAGSIFKQPGFVNKPYRTISDLSNSDYVMENGFWFGCHPGINSKKLNYICETFYNFLKKYV